MLATVPESRFHRVGHDLSRPECVLACASGRLFASDRRGGGVMAIEPDGTQRLIGRSTLVPNGIALRRDGSFLVGNMSDEGGLWQIGRDGAVTPFLTAVDGWQLPKVNFVILDARERIWISISATDTGEVYPVHSKTGRIVLVDERGPRIVADGLQYTNECRIDATGRYLFVNETFGQCLTRFTVADDGSLSERTRVATFDGADFPDGMALDAEGGVWVVCVGSNRLYRVAADGAAEPIIDDSVPEVAANLRRAFDSSTLTRTVLCSAHGHVLQNVSSIAFGGPDLRTAYLGSLNGDALVSFRSPAAGLPPVHWNWD